jgi:tetratricopeptide (TPR) repeat protein
MLEDYEKSLEQLDRCLEHNPQNIPAHTVKCYCLLKLGRCDEVLQYFEMIPANIQVAGEKLGLTGLAYAVKKDAPNTTKILEELEQVNGPDGFNDNSYLFLMYAVMGENDKAFKWVTQALENKSSLLLLRFTDPLVNSMKDDPRYFEFHKVIYKGI